MVKVPAYYIYTPYNTIAFILTRHFLYLLHAIRLEIFSDGCFNKNVPVILLPANTKMPEGLSLVKSGRQSYCIETDEACTIKKYNALIREISSSLIQMNRTEFLKINEEAHADLCRLVNSRAGTTFKFKTTYD